VACLLSMFPIHSRTEISVHGRSVHRQGEPSLTTTVAVGPPSSRRVRSTRTDGASNGASGARKVSSRAGNLGGRSGVGDVRTYPRAMGAQSVLDVAVAKCQTPKRTSTSQLTKSALVVGVRSGTARRTRSRPLILCDCTLSSLSHVSQGRTRIPKGGLKSEQLTAGHCWQFSTLPPGLYLPCPQSVQPF
jgi:hypothetical protein